MVVLSAKNIYKSYGTTDILRDITLHINQGDRVGIVGNNGEGKTTLMNILSGQINYDSGSIMIPKDIDIGYLKQSENFSENETLIEYVEKIFERIYVLEKEMNDISKKISEKSSKNEDVTKLLMSYDRVLSEYEKKGGNSYRSEIKGILSSMAFSEKMYEKKLSSLSGGEKTRLLLACLLLKKPNLLFLDEPTNHLDIGTLKWLEQYLKSYKGTIVLISHDRYFLNQTVNKIYEIEEKKIEAYSGDYDFYVNEKKQRRASKLKQYKIQKSEIDKEKELIRKFKERGTEKLAKRALSREKKLDKIQAMDKPKIEDEKIKIKFKQLFKSGNDVLAGKELSKTVGVGISEKKLFENVEFDIKSGERICIVGSNGIGKTTFLKMIIGQTNCTSGKIKTGYNVKFGYYDQEQKNLNQEKTVMEEMKDAYSLYTDKEMRNILAQFLFRGDDVFLKVGDLSGGEKARLSLLKLMLSGANVLIMDEPTNHLDIWSKEIFEEALLSFEGTSIIVSHDRYLLSKIPTKIYELNKTGITEYLGKYDYFMEKKDGLSSTKEYMKELNESNGSEEIKNLNIDFVKEQKKIENIENRELQKRKATELRRKKREHEKYEKEINEIEEIIKKIDENLCDSNKISDFEFLSEQSKKREELSERLEEVYELWSQTSE